MTPGQIEKIEALFKGHRDEFIDLRAEVEKLQGALSDTFENDPFDKNEAAAAADALEEARRRASRALTQFQIEIREVLTASQFKTLRPVLQGRPHPPSREGPPAPPPVPG